jgi:GNAT superfamily N-acetyltransferase
MDEKIRIRNLEDGEITKAHDLVASVFDEFVAPLFSAEGVDQFKSFIEPSNLADRLREDSFILVAEVGSEIIGVVGMRDWSHIFLLFVGRKYQGKGIAKKLVHAALQRCDDEGRIPDKVTVNSSPNAVGAYNRMGFVQTAEEEVRHGIRAVPMAMSPSPTWTEKEVNSET